MRETVESLESQKIDAVFASDLARVRPLAESLAQRHAAPLTFSPSLRERCFGVYQGRPQDEFDAGQAQSRLPPHEFRPPGGESCRDVAGRLAPLLAEIEERFAGKTVAVCAHGVVTGVLRALARRVPLEEGLRKHLAPGEAELLEIDRPPSADGAGEGRRC